MPCHLSSENVDKLFLLIRKAKILMKAPRLEAANRLAEQGAAAIKRGCNPGEMGFVHSCCITDPATFSCASWLMVKKAQERPAHTGYLQCDVKGSKGHLRAQLPSPKSLYAAEVSNS